MNITALPATTQHKITQAINDYVSTLPLEQQVDVETASLPVDLEQDTGGELVLVVSIQIGDRSQPIMRLDAGRFGIHYVDGQVVALEVD